MNTKLFQEDQKFLLNNYGRVDAHFTHGEGSWLYAADGKKYLDFISGIAVNALGHRPAVVESAIKKQMESYWHLSNLFPLEPQVQLAEKLVQHSAFDKAFFCNSGTEANEAAIKFARKFFARNGEDDRFEIISFTHSFHGRTYGGMNATGQPKIREGFGPRMDGFTTLPWNDVKTLEQSVSAKTAAIILEPMEAEGGLHQPTQEFVDCILHMRQVHQCLVILDEVQTGLGRLGKLWGAEKYGLQGDLMTLAKPLGGGLPIGGVLMLDKVAEKIQPGDHGSTFGGNPLSCAAGIAILDEVTRREFLQQLQESATYFEAGLQKIESESGKVLEVCGTGMLRGLRLKEPPLEAINACRQQGLLVLRAGTDILRLIPPLNVSQEELDYALEILAKVLSE